MMSLKDYIARVIDEENTQGDEGTSKLTKNRMRMTPGEKEKTPPLIPQNINNRGQQSY